LNGEAASLLRRTHAAVERQRLAPTIAAAPNDNGGASPEPDEAPASAPAHKTLLLVDGVRLRRECLIHLLSAELPDFEIVAVASARPSEVWRTAGPEIVLVNAPPFGGLPIGEIEEIGAATTAPVLLLSEAESGFNADQAAEFGVAGVFPATCGSSLLIAAIQLVLAGGRVQIPARRPAILPSRIGRGATG
jgi:DNA-binding NarL/FixJ family response regulator